MKESAGIHDDRQLVRFKKACKDICGAIVEAQAGPNRDGAVALRYLDEPLSDRFRRCIVRYFDDDLLDEMRA